MVEPVLKGEGLERSQQFDEFVANSICVNIEVSSNLWTEDATGVGVYFDILEIVFSFIHHDVLGHPHHSVVASQSLVDSRHLFDYPNIINWHYVGLAFRKKVL